MVAGLYKGLGWFRDSGFMMVEGLYKGLGWFRD